MTVDLHRRDESGSTVPRESSDPRVCSLSTSVPGPVLRHPGRRRTKCHCRSTCRPASARRGASLCWWFPQPRFPRRCFPQRCFPQRCFPQRCQMFQNRTLPAQVRPRLMSSISKFSWGPQPVSVQSSGISYYTSVPENEPSIVLGHLGEIRVERAAGADSVAGSPALECGNRPLSC